MEKKTILLVKNNPEDEQLIISALKKNNIMSEVVIARDGHETLDYLFGTGSYAGRDMSVMPQVILMDLKIPKIDGLEVLRRLRNDERTKSIPVVVHTSSMEERDLNESYRLGANSYIRKSADSDQLKATILYWLDLNESPPKGGMIYE